MSDHICPKFESCSAPICPIEKDWALRKHLDGERICFYLNEYAKEANRDNLQRVMPREMYLRVVEVYPQIIISKKTIKKALHRASVTPSRLGRAPCKPTH